MYSERELSAYSRLTSCSHNVSFSFAVRRRRFWTSYPPSPRGDETTREILWMHSAGNAAASTE